MKVACASVCVRVISCRHSVLCQQVESICVTVDRSKQDNALRSSNVNGCMIGTPHNMGNVVGLMNKVEEQESSHGLDWSK